MKIGILTLPLHTNYGGNLQAYALMKTLKGLGHDVWLINRRPNKINSLKFPFTLMKRIVKKYLLKQSEIEIFLEHKYKKEYPIISQYTQPFIENNIFPQTVSITSSSDFPRLLKDYNFQAIIVGSDQVWRPKYVSVIEEYYLSFISSDSCKKISYAASFGTSDWEYTIDQALKCKNEIKKFDFVSVREDSGVELCSNHFEINAQRVLDPTMLLNSKDYISLFENQISKQEEAGEILVYLLDENKEKKSIVSFIEKSLSKKSFLVNSQTENKQASLESRIAPPTEDWLRGFQKASFIISDSFHACVFSIIFNKPFIAIGNKKRGITRFTSLLNLFGLETRLVFSLEELSKDLVNQNIDYNKVNSILEDERNKSINFLKAALIN